MKRCADKGMFSTSNEEEEEEDDEIHAGVWRSHESSLGRFFSLIFFTWNWNMEHPHFLRIKQPLIMLG